MRDALRCSQTWLKWLEKWSLSQRHGSPTFMSGAERVEAIRRARTLIVRFAHYLNDGEEPLSSAQFPELDD
jgi:hypothetical protein